MGWNIGGDLRRSDTSTHNLGQQIAHVLPARDWRTVRDLFNRSSGDPFTVPPKEAREMARVLSTAAGHRKMPADWAKEAKQLADSAQRAAFRNQPWNWG